MTSRPPHQPPIQLSEEEESGVPRAVWLMIAALLFAKLATIAVILLVEFTWTSGALVVITTWTWVVVAAVLLPGPLALAYRLRKVRAKRETLRRQEWLIESGAKEKTGTAQPPAGGD